MAPQGRDKDTEPTFPAGHRTRRDVIRCGAKAAWITPVVLTFTARDAVAAGSNHSCYPEGHTCIEGGTVEDGNPEPCCAGLNCIGPPPKTCQPPQ
jgi:hypothetical protein